MSTSSHLILDYTLSSQTYINSASSLKPIFVWLGMKKLSAYVLPNEVASVDFSVIITHSDNELTDKFISSVISLEELTEELNSLLGERHPRLEVPETWGRFKVNAGMIFLFYSALVNAGTDESNKVLALMKSVTSHQRFGVSNEYSMKAGWDLVDASKLVLLIVKIDGNHVKVLTASSDYLSSQEIARWNELEILGSEDLVPFHTKFFNQELKTFHSLSK